MRNVLVNRSIVLSMILLLTFLLMKGGVNNEEEY